MALEAKLLGRLEVDEQLDRVPYGKTADHLS
jgi:hypothetical protein